MIPALSHIMLQSDTLANEFNDILNGVEIFAPFQPLDPAVTFYAPLRTTVRDLRLNQDDFQRNSDAWYKDGSGIYRHVGINRARFEQSQLLMEPAQTNKNTNYNANPDSELINVVAGAGQKNRVFDPVSIAAAGLQDICPSGFLVELFNDTGSDYNAGPAGFVGNLNVHAASVWANTFGNTISFGLGGNRRNINTTSLEFVEYVGVGTTDLSTLVFRLGPGERVHFILNQLEESPVVTSPIVTEGTAGQRGVDLLSYLETAMVQDAAGMAIMKVIPQIDRADIPEDWTNGLLSLNDNVSRFMFIRYPPAGEPTLRLNDGTNVRVGPELFFSAGDVLICAARWNGVGMQCGYHRGSSWDWGTEGPYRGAWDKTDNLAVLLSNDYPFQVSDIEIFDEDRGQAWIEANYP